MPYDWFKEKLALRSQPIKAKTKRALVRFPAFKAIFTSSSHRLIAIFSFILIGRSDNSIEIPSIKFLSEQKANHSHILRACL